MKKEWLSYLLDLGVVFLILLALSLFSFGQQPDLVKNQTIKLKKELKLNASQTAEVAKILVMSRKQALKDRETFKTDAVALVSAARQRRNRERLLINNLLLPEQKKLYKKFQRKSFMERELFMLSEGLLLTPDQAFTVEGILIEHYEKFKDMMPQGRMGTGMRPRGGGGGMRGGGMGRMGRRGMSMMRNFNAKKNKKIKKVLTKPQKKLLKQLQKDMEKKRRERMKQMRSRRFGS